MESKGSAAAATATATTSGIRHHHRRKPPSSVRLLSIPPQSFPHLRNSHEAELTEHDIFCSYPEFSSASSPASTSTAAIRISRSHSHNQQGILAALPVESKSETRSVFNHKASSASVSPSPAASLASLSSSHSSSSSARLIVPKRPPQPRKLFQQSAPVNVPLLSEAMRRNTDSRLFDDVIEDNEDEEDKHNAELMPPHEILASKPTPMLACSVLEGVGRTLKGRDLRQVRNAVWRRTGFLD